MPWTSKRNAAANRARRAKSFTRFGGELFTSLENFTNQHYEYYPGYPMGGILWYIGCKFKF